MLKYYMSTETCKLCRYGGVNASIESSTTFTGLWALHRELYASSVVSAAGLFQGIKVLSPTITTCALQSYMPAQCPRYFLANATQIMVRCAWQSKHHIPR